MLRSLTIEFFWTLHVFGSFPKAGMLVFVWWMCDTGGHMVSRYGFWKATCKCGGGLVGGAGGLGWEVGVSITRDQISWEVPLQMERQKLQTGRWQVSLHSNGSQTWSPVARSSFYSNKTSVAYSDSQNSGPAAFKLFFFFFFAVKFILSQQNCFLSFLIIILTGDCVAGVWSNLIGAQDFYSAPTLTSSCVLDNLSCVLEWMNE